MSTKEGSPMSKAISTAILTLLATIAFGLTGFGVSGPVSLDNVSPSVSLVAPNGGESWPAGSSQLIQWQASDSHFGPAPIDMALSVNGGGYSTFSTGTANDGSEIWVVPGTHSNQAMVRITAKDSFGNTSHRMSAGYFSITAAYPLPPEGISIELSNSLDVVISWQPVTQNVDGSPFTADGYIVLHSNDAGSDPNDFIILGSTNATTYTHQNAAQISDTSFYYVVAYSDPDGRVADLLHIGKTGSTPYSTIKQIMPIIPVGQGSTK